MTPEQKLQIERLFRDYARGIGGYALARLGDAARAEEVTARVYLQVVKAIGQLRGPPAPWLWAIARNELAREARPIRLMTQLPDELLELRPSVDEAAVQQEASDELQVALARLTDDQQQMIWLKFYQESTNAEIATALGLTASNVGVRLYRSLQELRGILERENR